MAQGDAVSTLGCRVWAFQLCLLLQEAKAADGLQRHIWWRVTLPAAPELTAYFSPIFDAVWYATDSKHLHTEAPHQNSARFAFSHTLHRAHLFTITVHLPRPQCFGHHRCW